VTVRITMLVHIYPGHLYMCILAFLRTLNLLACRAGLW